MQRPVLGRPQCGGRTASGGSGAGGPRCAGWGRWAAKGEGAGAAAPGSGPRQELCDKSPDLSVPSFVVTVETGHATVSAPRDPLVVCPQRVGFELVARAPGECGW